MIYEVTMANGDVTYVDTDSMFHSGGVIQFTRYINNETGARAQPEDIHRIEYGYGETSFRNNIFLTLAPGTWHIIKQAPEEIQLTGV